MRKEIVLTLPNRYLGSVILMVCLSLWVAPAARAQSQALYFPASGHHLTDTYGFLSFWRAHDGERLLGFPITEVLFVDRVAMQFFEKGRLEQHIDTTSGAAQVRTGNVGSEYTEALWRTFPAPPPRKPIEGELVFESTGHTLRTPFLQFWQAAGGLDFFGEPISEPLWEQTEQGRRKVQYFKRARLERDASVTGSPGEILVSNLGRSLANLRGLDTAPVPNWGAETYGPAAPLQPDVASLPGMQPAPTPIAGAAPRTTPRPKATPMPAKDQRPAVRPNQQTSKRHIVVNLSKQWLYAFEDGAQIFDAPVSTGRDGMNTPVGNFAIYTKLKSQTMTGVDDGVPWRVPNVPNVMYIHGGVALHGTYWHNQFGTGARLSHGCINLPLKAAEWLYSWAPVGTPVKVKY